MTQALNQRRHVLSSVYSLNVTTEVGAQPGGRQPALSGNKEW